MKKFGFRKFFKYCIVFVFITWFLWFAVYNNLRSGSVYYARYTPHKVGVEAELMMLVDNLMWIHVPENIGLEYDVDAFQEHYNFDGTIAYFSKSSTGGYSFSDKNDVNYYFDKNFKLVDVVDKDYNKIDVETVDVEKVKKNLYEDLAPILDEQSEPFMNLQWLFDLVHKDKFN